MEDILIPDSYTWLEQPSNFKDLIDYLDYLKHQCSEKLSVNCNPKYIKGIVVPHAGIKYSGICSMSSYLPVSMNQSINKIIVLSTDHHYNSKSGIYLQNFHYYDNNKNKFSVKIHKQTKQLFKNKSLFELRDIKDEITKEHSLLNQLPFLSYLFPSVKIIPVIVGSDNLTKIHKSLSKLINKNTLVVCNADFEHVNGHFKDKITKNINSVITYRDSLILKLLSKNDNIELNSQYVSDNGLTTCSYNTLNLMKKIANKYSVKKTKRKNNKTNSLQLKVASYFTSFHITNFVDYTKDLKLNDITRFFKLNNTNESSVSYAGLLFTTKARKQKRIFKTLFTDFEKAALIQYSMTVALNHLSTDKIPDEYLFPIYSPEFYNKYGCFVTIDNKIFDHIDKKQRGCIGVTDVNKDMLVNNVVYYTLQSCFYDKRYPPITYDELFTKIDKNYSIYEFKKDFSISLLNKLIPIPKSKFLNKKVSFKVGQDAVTIKYNQKNSVYLTNDAELHGLTKEVDMLKMLCRKMGEKESCIKDVKVFHQEGFPIKSSMLF